MMTKRKTFTSTILLAVLILFSSTSWSQSKEKQQVLQRLKAQEACWNKGDMEGYLSFYASVDSVRMIYSKGVVYGKDSIDAFFRKYWPKERMGKLLLDEIVIEVLSKKDAFVSARFTVDFLNGKTTGGRFSGIMRKIKGKWYIYVDHSG